MDDGLGDCPAYRHRDSGIRPLIPDLPADCWLSRAHSYVRERSMLPDWATFWILMTYCGASLGDRVFVDWAPKPIFPNLPLLVVMPSGRGKTGAMNAARPLFDKCLPYRIPEDSTAESAIKMFSQQGRSHYGNSVCIWEIPELADVFGRKDYQQGLIARVTRLLDAPKDKEVSRSTDSFQIRIQGHAVMSWVAGTTFEWLGAHVEDAVSSGGFLPRLISLYSSEPPKWIPNPVRDEAVERELNGELYQQLQGIGGRTSTPITLPDEWMTVSKTIYDELVASGDAPNTPFIARRQENTLRIWLILQTLTTSYDTLTTSHNCAKWLETQSVNLAEDLLLRQNPLLQRVLGYVVSRPEGVSFAKLCRAIRGITAYQAEGILTDLVKQGLVEWKPRLHGETGVVRPLEQVEDNGQQ